MACLAAPAWAAPPVVGAEKPASTPLYQGKPGSQHSSAVAWNAPAGKFLVVWVDDDMIRGELVSPAGVRDTPTSSFAIPTGGNPFNLDLTAKGATTLFLLAWEQNGAVWGARILDDQPLGAPFVISDAENVRNQDARQGEPAVASNGTDFLVTWSDARRNSTFSENSHRDGFDVYAARVSGAIFPSDLIFDDEGFPVAADGVTSAVVGTSPEQRFVSQEQQQPTVAWDGTNYLVAWAGAHPGGALPHVRARFVTSAGATSGAAFAVSDAANPSERNPEVAWNAANSVYFVVWTTGSGSGDIVGSRVNTSASVLDSPARVFAEGPTNQDRARVLVNGSNSYTIVWDDGADVYGLHAVRIAIIGPENWLVGPTNLVSGEAGDDVMPSLTTNGAPTGTPGPTLFAAWTAGSGGTDANVHAKRVNVAGIPFDASPIVISASAGPQEDPFLAWNGSYLAGFTERRPPTSSTTHDVYRARLDAAGNPLDGSGLLTLDDVSNTFEPPGIARGAVTYLVTWAHQFDVYAQVLDAAGTPVGGPIAIYTDFLSTQPAPAVAWNGASYLVVWRHNPGIDQGVRGVRVNESGTVLDSTPIVAGSGGNGVSAPRLASDGGNWLVTWGQLGPGTGSEVVARRIDRDGGVLGLAPTAVTSLEDDQRPTGVAWDGDRFLIAWDDDRDAGISTSDVYAGRVGEDGTPLDGTGIPVAVAPGGTGGQQAAVAANGKNFVVSWRTFDGNVRAARVSGAGAVVDPGGVLVGGGGQALEWPALTASSPGRVAVAYARTANEAIYGGVGRAFFRFVDEDVLPAADTTPPSNPSLSSPSHQLGVASNDDTVAVEWTGAADAGSGVDGYSHIWSASASELPPGAKNAAGETSSATSPPLATGTWYFHLRTRDKAGNWNNSAVTLGPFLIDTMPPETTIDSGPGGTSSVSFAFSSSENGSTFACSLDGAAAASCTSPAAYSGLAAGEHTFAVTATDPAGNEDPTPATSTWIVPDTTPPGLTLTAKAAAKLGSVRLRGYPFRARCSEACTLVAQLRLSAKLARRLKVAQVAAQVKRTLPAGQTRSLVLALKPKAKRKLGTLRTVHLTLVVTVTDAAGNDRTVRRTLTLRR